MQCLFFACPKRSFVLGVFSNLTLTRVIMNYYRELTKFSYSLTHVRIHGDDEG